MNARDISTELSISIGNVESIIHKHLQYQKVTVRWVRKLLNFEQKFAARHTLDTILELLWKVLEHPHDSPDLSPRNYHVWTSEKTKDVKDLRGARAQMVVRAVQGILRYWYEKASGKVVVGGKYLEKL